MHTLQCKPADALRLTVKGGLLCTIVEDLRAGGDDTWRKLKYLVELLALELKLKPQRCSRPGGLTTVPRAGEQCKSGGI